MRRILSLPNLLFVGVAIGLFALAFPFLDTTLGFFATALVAAGAGTAAWWVARRYGGSDAPIAGAAIRVGIGVVGLMALSIALSGAQVFASWNSIEREGFAIDDARQALEEPSTENVDEPVETTTTIAGQTTTTTLPPAPNESFNTLLLIGGDAASGNGDVILYLVQPTNGAEPFMMSFPRDLWIDNPCTGGSSRINVLARGCSSKDINGGTLLSIKVSDLTGIDVDHFALFGFDGFEQVIDAVGGIELCFEYAVRDLDSELDLPAGCSNVGGEQALAWVRSRHTQENRDGGWYRMPGASDLLRNQHQQEVILKLIAKLKRFESPQQLASVVESVSNAFTLSDTLSLQEALGLAWSFRDTNLDSIQRLEIPVYLTRSPSNQSIVKAEMSPREVIEAHYGGALPSED